MSIFYRRVQYRYQLALDTASNGDFSTKMVHVAQILVSNFAASNANNCLDHATTSRPTSSHSNEYIELKAMLNVIQNQQAKKCRAIKTKKKMQHTSDQGFYT